MTQLTGPPLDNTEVERALGRIGIPNRDPFRWEALNWFVVFAQRDLAEATDAAWHLLNEEGQALLHLVAQQQLAVGFSREEWEALQSTAMAWLTRLVDEGAALMGKFEIRIFVRRGARPLAGPPRMKSWGGLTCLPLHNFAGHIPPGGLPGLQYHLASLLERWPETVQRCPKCQRLFARLRRHAAFCSRKCQSQVAAHDRRVRIAEQAKIKQAEKEAKPKAKMKKRTTKKLKGSHHGQKTR